jgi:hypothetical protein
MYLDAEISDQLDIAMLLKTKNKELLYARPMFVIGHGVDYASPVTLLASWMGYYCFVCASKPGMVLSYLWGRK